MVGHNRMEYVEVFLKDYNTISDEFGSSVKYLQCNILPMHLIFKLCSTVVNQKMMLFRNSIKNCLCAKLEKLFESAKITNYLKLNMENMKK